MVALILRLPRSYFGPPRMCRAAPRFTSPCLRRKSGLCVACHHRSFGDDPLDGAGTAPAPDAAAEAIVDSLCTRRLVPRWGCRSAVRSLNLITDDCGLPRTLHTVPFFNSICRHTHLARKRIVEDVCSIHMAANVSWRVCAERRIWRTASAPGLQPSATRMLGAPFRSGSPHVV